MCEFAFRNEPRSPEDSEDDQAEIHVLRNRIIDSLTVMFRDLDRNWQRDLPTDRALLEELENDLSLVFGMR